MVCFLLETGPPLHQILSKSKGIQQTKQQGCHTENEHS